MESAALAPPLSNLSDRKERECGTISRELSVEPIASEFVWPALNIKEDDEAATVNLKDGTVVTGCKQTDPAEAIALGDLVTVPALRIPRSEAKEVGMGRTMILDARWVYAPDGREVVGAFGEVFYGLGDGVRDEGFTPT